MDLIDDAEAALRIQRDNVTANIFCIVCSGDVTGSPCTGSFLGMGFPERSLLCVHGRSSTTNKAVVTNRNGGSIHPGALKELSMTLLSYSLSGLIS